MMKKKKASPMKGRKGKVKYRLNFELIYGKPKKK